MAGDTGVRSTLNSPCHVTAVDGDDAPGQERRKIARSERDDSGDIIRTFESSEWQAHATSPAFSSNESPSMPIARIRRGRIRIHAGSNGMFAPMRLPTSSPPPV